MKKHLDIANYDPYWKWAKKIRYVLTKSSQALTSKEVSSRILLIDNCEGYKNQGTERTLESKTAGILKIYLDRGEVERELIGDKYKYRLKEKGTDIIVSVPLPKIVKLVSTKKYCRPRRFRIVRYTISKG